MNRLARLIAGAIAGTAAVLLLTAPADAKKYDGNPTWNPHGSYTTDFSYYFPGAKLNTAKDFNEGWVSGSGDTGPVNSNETAGYNSNLISLTGTGYLKLPLKYGQQITTSKGTYPNTGTLIDTYGKRYFTPGTHGLSVESRIYLPGSGSTVYNWPAFWMDGEGLNWPTDGEADIMEGLGGRTCYHFHDPSGGPGGCSNVGSGWHTFGASWHNSSITYYYDNKAVGTISSGITNKPMFLIFDYTTSTNSGNSATLKVDWVKVWQNNTGGE